MNEGDFFMTQGTLPYAYFRKKVIPAQEAKISIASNSLQYGTNCFAGIRGYVRDGNVRIFRLRDHFERLMNAASILTFSFTLTYQEFFEILQEMVRKNAPAGDFYIRPFIFSEDEQLGPRPKGLTFDLAIYFVSMATRYAYGEGGLSLTLSSWRKFSDAALPTKAKAGGCYVNSFLAASDALRHGYDDALMMDSQGFIVEASVANILCVYRGMPISPMLGDAELDGITLRTAIELLEEEQIVVKREKIDRSMIYSLDELLLLGTAVEVATVKEVDGRQIGARKKEEGAMHLLLKEKFRQVFAGSHPKSKQWLVPIPISP